MIFKLKIIIFILSINLNLFSSQEEEIIGNISYYNIREGENLIEISRKNNLSFPEVMIANPKIKEWREMESWLLKGWLDATR